MNKHTLRQLLPLSLLAAMLLPACARQAPVATTVPVPTVAAAAATIAPTEVATVAPAAAPAELYMPREVKAAFAAGTHSPDGKPGPNYWQNRSVHDIAITIAPPSRTISATETITYTNNSPNPMPILGLRLYMNVHKPVALREEHMPAEFLNDGITIGEVRLNGQPIIPGQFIPFGQTAAILKLAEPLASGASITVDTTWSYDLAPANGWKEGVIDDTSFYLAYFYPRVALYAGTESPLLLNFDLDEFTARSGREAVNEFADFTVSVNAPKNFVVWATGDLQNPDEVLQPEYAKRLADSFTSDQVVKIASPEETQQGLVTTQSDTVTWRWKADNVSDFALGLSDHWVWDAGSVVVDPASGRRASVQAAYPSDATDYTTMVEDGRAALSFGSTQWPGVPYPYSKTTIFAGGADEEYPMMVNDSPAIKEEQAKKGVTSRMVAAHELLHSWFPFYMGIDERRYPSMDEGWTTAFEYLFDVADLGAEKGVNLFRAFRMADMARTLPGIDLPIIYPADSTRNSVVGFNAYQRPALAYLALKELVGDEAFKQALNAFIERWNGKHPLPWDMFNTFNDVSGQDLNWFFQRWFFEPNYVDLTVAGVEKTDSGVTVQVKNVGGMPIPFDVVATYADGTSETFHQSPALWQESPEAAIVQISGTKELATLTLDAGIYTDVTPDDNAWASPDAAPTAAQAPAAEPSAATAPAAEPSAATAPAGEPTSATAPAATTAAGEDPAKLRANAWQWASYSGATEQFTVEKPASYTLSFGADGALTIKADCNQAAGTYEAEGGTLTLKLGLTTLVACPAGSRGDQLLKLLSGAALYRFDGANLIIELMADGGTLEFVPAN
ncbi:MAG: META domain-containing protein [Chloroflexales bacterium]|nr:META domain-containing protein [Chloroflexales bacterium]